MPPEIMAIISIYPLDTKRLRMTLGFILSFLIFLERVDIWIIVIDDGCYLMRQQPFNDGARARRAARVQQYVRTTFRHYDGALFRHKSAAKVRLFLN